MPQGGMEDIDEGEVDWRPRRVEQRDERRAGHKAAKGHEVPQGFGAVVAPGDRITYRSYQRELPQVLLQPDTDTGGHATAREIDKCHDRERAECDHRQEDEGFS